jgi:hypothetical protein
LADGAEPDDAGQPSLPRDHAERVLGHAMPGVEVVYDRHSYEVADRPNPLIWEAPAAGQQMSKK